MGEIGITRREFLYDIRFWEARRIIRGYRKRYLPLMQIMAENVYASTFSMRDAQGRTVKDMFPSLFQDEDDMVPPMTEEEKAELQALMDAENARLEAAKLAKADS